MRRHPESRGAHWHGRWGPPGQVLLVDKLMSRPSDLVLWLSGWQHSSSIRSRAARTARHRQIPIHAGGVGCPSSPAEVHLHGYARGGAMPRVADWNLPAPAGSGSERRSLPMAQGRSEGSRSPKLAGFHTVSLLRVRAVSSRFRCFVRGRFRHGFVSYTGTSRFRHGFVASGAGLKRANRNQGVQCRLEEIRTHWQQPMARGRFRHGFVTHTHWQQPMARGRQEWQSRSPSTKGPPFAAASTGQHRRRRTSPSTNRSPQCSDRRRWGGGSQGGPA